MIGTIGGIISVTKYYCDIKSISLFKVIGVMIPASFLLLHGVRDAAQQVLKNIKKYQRKGR